VVYSLITDDTRTNILMVRNRKNGQWTLPGGAVEQHETLEDAAIREAKEETGYDIRVFGIVAVNEAFLEKHDEHAIFFTFRGEIIGGRQEVSRQGEIIDLRWVALEEADKLMPYYKEGLSGLVRQGTEVTYVNEGRV